VTPSLAFAEGCVGGPFLGGCFGPTRSESWSGKYRDSSPRGHDHLTPIGSTRQHFLDLNRNPIAAHDDRALGDWKIVSENLHLVVLGGVELYDGAATKTQNLVDGHRRDAEHHGDVK
jgi:hypothetical protein